MVFGTFKLITYNYNVFDKLLTFQENHYFDIPIDYND